MPPAPAASRFWDKVLPCFVTCTLKRQGVLPFSSPTVLKRPVSSHFLAWHGVLYAVTRMGLEMVGGGDIGEVVAWTLVGETERTKSANNTLVLADAALLMLFNRFTEFYRCFFSG